MLVVAQRALQMADRASEMAQRGMLFSARTELIHAQQLISQALDTQQGGNHHAAALASALASLEEARGFAAHSSAPGEAVNVAAVAAGHRTKLLSGISNNLSPVAAQQQYFGYAQGQLLLAGGGLPASSQILYRLGRLQTAMGAHDADPLALHGPQAMVFHQAALATDSANWLAANELGVMLAKYGQWIEARQLLVHSVSTHPHTAGWQNLASVHRSLGEIDLAQRAENERQILAQRAGGATSDPGNMVRWVDTKTFAASGGGDLRWPDSTAAAKSAAAASASVSTTSVRR
jgi:tetratricopeptide (TPR) repeat protein